MVKYNDIDKMDLHGGLLCLNFINTVHGRTQKPYPDYLFSIFDLIYWAKRVEIIDRKSYRVLNSYAEKHDRESAAFFKDAIYFRELLYEIFQDIIPDKKISKKSLAAYNKIIKTYFPYLQINQSNKTFIEEWNLDTTDFKRLLAPVLNDSYETLLSDKLSRIKECPNCGWLFYDTTKNSSRRWCSMKVCGSNVKALEWYHRQKAL